MSSEFVSLVTGLLIRAFRRNYLNFEGKGGTFLRHVENKCVAAPSKKKIQKT